MTRDGLVSEVVGRVGGSRYLRHYPEMLTQIGERSSKPAGSFFGYTLDTHRDARYTLRA